MKSLEDVVRGYLKLAEEKTEEARLESQTKAGDVSSMGEDVDDLDNLQTPERQVGQSENLKIQFCLKV